MILFSGMCERLVEYALQMRSRLALDELENTSGYLNLKVSGLTMIFGFGFLPGQECKMC